MCKKIAPFFTLLMAVFSVSTAIAQDSDYEIPWATFNNGGGISTGDDYILYDSINSLYIEQQAGGPYILDTGFWQYEDILDPPRSILYIYVLALDNKPLSPGNLSGLAIPTVGEIVKATTYTKTAVILPRQGWSGSEGEFC